MMNTTSNSPAATLDIRDHALPSSAAEASADLPAVEAGLQPEAPIDLPLTDSEQDALTGGCINGCGGIRFNHNETLAESVGGTDEAVAEPQAEAPIDLPLIEAQQDGLKGGCLNNCGGIRFNHNETLAESVEGTDEAEAEPQAEAPIDLPLTDSEQDALTGGCGGACGGIRFNHNETLAESVGGTDEAVAQPQPEAPIDLPLIEAEQDGLKGGCLNNCGGIRFNHNETLAESVDGTDEAEAEPQPEAPIDLPLIEAEQDALTGGCGGACGGILFNHNETLAESVDGTDDAEAEPQAEAPIDLSLIEAEQDGLKGGCINGCGGIKFNHNQTLAESVDAGRGS